MCNSMCLYEWMNEWCIYKALYCVLPYTQSALQSWGGSLLNHHQCAASTWMMKRWRDNLLCRHLYFLFIFILFYFIPFWLWLELDAYVHFSSLLPHVCGLVFRCLRCFIKLGKIRHLLVSRALLAPHSVSHLGCLTFQLGVTISLFYIHTGG